MDVIQYSILLATASLSLACSPEGYREIHMDEMAATAPIIAYGRITRKFAIEYAQDAYIAEMNVKCTYKGGPLPSMINITGAGYMPGMCGNRNFTVDMEYFAFLSMTGRDYYQHYDQTMEASSSMAELMTYCDLTMDYPVDRPNVMETCLSPNSDASNCRRYENPNHFHPRPPPPNVEGNPALPNLGEPGSGDDMSSSETGLLRTADNTVTMSNNGTTTSTSTVSDATRTLLSSTVTPSARGGSARTLLPVLSILVMVLSSVCLKA